jgi:hypothetical protein
MQNKVKRVAFEKNYLISPQQEHFEIKFQLILEAIVQGYNFRILPIFGSWSCDHQLNIPSNKP